MRACLFLFVGFVLWNCYLTVSKSWYFMWFGEENRVKNVEIYVLRRLIFRENTNFAEFYEHVCAQDII